MALLGFECFANSLRCVEILLLTSCWFCGICASLPLFILSFDNRPHVELFVAEAEFILHHLFERCNHSQKSRQFCVLNVLGHRGHKMNCDRNVQHQDLRSGCHKNNPRCWMMQLKAMLRLQEYTSNKTYILKHADSKKMGDAPANLHVASLKICFGTKIFWISPSGMSSM